MADFPTDIYTEPDADVDTLKNLGPLTGMAGIWKSAASEDIHPTAGGPEQQAFLERYELQPIDPQTNGPQLLYGLRYHTHIVKPGSVETFHDQVGYWLWEPATETIFYTLSIPRAQVAMAVGHATSSAKKFRLEAVRGSETNGIVSNPFLLHAFKDATSHDGGDDPPGRHVVVRAGHGDGHPRCTEGIPPHRSQHAQEDRRTHAEPTGRASREPDRTADGPRHRQPPMIRRAMTAAGGQQLGQTWAHPHPRRRCIRQGVIRSRGRVPRRRRDLPSTAGLKFVPHRA